MVQNRCPQWSRCACLPFSFAVGVLLRLLRAFYICRGTSESQRGRESWPDTDTHPALPPNAAIMLASRSLAAARHRPAPFSSSARPRGRPAVSTGAVSAGKPLERARQAPAQ